MTGNLFDDLDRECSGRLITPKFIDTISKNVYELLKDRPDGYYDWVCGIVNAERYGYPICSVIKTGCNLTFDWWWGDSTILRRGLTEVEYDFDLMRNVIGNLTERLEKLEVEVD